MGMTALPVETMPSTDSGLLNKIGAIYCLTTSTHGSILLLALKKCRHNMLSLPINRPNCVADCESLIKRGSPPVDFTKDHHSIHIFRQGVVSNVVIADDLRSENNGFGQYN